MVFAYKGDAIGRHRAKYSDAQVRSEFLLQLDKPALARLELEAPG